VLGNFTALVAAAALGGAPIALAAPTEPAPTDVTLAWNSSAHDGATITWSETGDVRNRVDVVAADGSTIGENPQYTEAGQPNGVPLQRLAVDTSYRVEVRVVDAAGNVLSEPGFSPDFDTDRQPPAVITTVVPHEDGSILMTWEPGKYNDPNPGDPLDVPPVLPYKYIPIASTVPVDEYDELSGPTAARRFLVPSRQSPVDVGLRAVPNEWSYQTGGDPTLSVQGTGLTATIPHTATIGGKLTITGKSERLVRFCSHFWCQVDTYDDGGRGLQVQSRTSAGAAWHTVATTRAGKTGTFSVKVPFAASADYRVVAPVVTWKRSDGNRKPRSYASTEATAVEGVAGGGSGDNGAGEGGGGGGLPITGPPAGWIAAIGGLLVLLGGGLALATRPRRPTS
jgi:hypothetical protein